MPSMLTSVAPVVCHVNVVGCPGSTVLGFADSDAVGLPLGWGRGWRGSDFLVACCQEHDRAQREYQRACISLEYS